MIFEIMTSTQQSVIGFILPGGTGLAELLVFSFIVLLLFGKRLPDVMGSLGRSIVEFKKGVRKVERPITDDAEPNRETES